MKSFRLSTKQSKQKAEKQIAEYQSQIKENITINNDLTTEINTLQEMIQANHKVLSSVIVKPVKLMLEVDTATKKYKKLLDEKAQLESQCHIYDHVMKHLPDEIEMIKDENNLLKKDLEAKIAIINKLEKDISKERKNHMFKEASEEVIVVAPTVKTLDLYGQIPFDSFDTTKKVSNTIKDKQQSQMLDIAIQSIETELENLQKNQTLNNPIDDLNDSSHSERVHTKMSIGDMDEIVESDYDAHHQHFYLEAEDNTEDQQDPIEAVIVSFASDDKENSLSQHTNNQNLKEEIETTKKDLAKIEATNLQYKTELENYKQNYKRLRDEIHRLTKVIKKNSLSAQDSDNK